MRSLDEVRALLAQRRQGEGQALAPVAPSRAEQPVLSAAQRNIWAKQQLDPASCAYNLCLRLTFRWDDGAEPVDERRLVEAFHTVVRRHEVLRTTYPTGEDGEPWQCVHDLLPPQVRQHPPGTDVHVVTREAVARPFDLAVDTPMRLDLVRVGEQTLVVVMTLQHIVWDGMTMSVLARELSAAYLTQELPAPTWQVADFAAEEQTSGHEGARTYWKGVFRDGVPQLALPLEHEDSETGARRDHRLSVAADANLRSLAKEHRTTPFAVFIAAFHLALRVVTGQVRTVIGTTVANREQPGQDQLFGNFSNQIPLLLDGSAVLGTTFADLVATTTTVIADAFRHKTLPTAEIAAAAGIDRSAGEELFSTMVLFLTQDIAGPQLPGVSCNWELIDNKAALHPLALEVFHHPGHTEVQFTHQRRLSADLVDSVAEILDTVIASATSSCPLRELLVLGRRDRSFLDQHARGARREIEPATVDGMLRDAAESCADNPAVVVCDAQGQETQRLTYAQFDAEVNRLTRELLARGVATGDRVLVATGRSVWLPIAMAAVLRAGACHVPVDPRHPPRRIREVAMDASPSLVLVAGIASREPGSYGDIVVIDLDDVSTQAQLRARSAASVTVGELTRPLSGEDPCYLIHTSGSTGSPKGVLNLHRGVANHLQWYGRTFLRGRRCRVLQKAPVTFDVGLAELLNPLSSGGTTVIPPADWWEGEVEALARMVAHQRIQVLSLVPSHLRVILDTVENLSGMRCLEDLLLGGEAVPGNLALRARELLGCRVHSLYGPTEAAMDVTWVEFTPELAVAAGESLIGRPEDNVTVRILGPGDVEVPVGVPGELCLVGAQVAAGYWNREVETSRAFGISPVEQDGGERMYRTGDIASWRRDGQLVFHGRTGEQVKIRGNRVELGEVEAALLEVPGVHQAAVAVWAGRLVGYVVPAPGVHLLLDDVVEIMGRRVPSYMVVELLVELEDLPLTAQGKLDRAALPEPQLAGGDDGQLEGAQRRVAEVMAEVLGLGEPPGPRSSLFSLGGDSIAAIRVVAGLRRVGLEVSARAVLAARDIAELAQGCRDARGVPKTGEWGPRRAPVPPLGVPLTTLDEQSVGLVQFTVLRLDAGIDLTEVTARLDGVLRQHPVLAARLLPDGWLELPGEVPGCRIDVAEEIRITDSDSLQPVVVKLAQALAPSEGRMMTAGVYGPVHHRCLVIVASHLVVDGVSWRVIQRELAASEVSDPENGFLRWAAMLAEQSAAGQDRDWLTIMEQVSGRVMLEAGLDVERTASTHRIVLGSGMCADLIDASRALGCDLLDLILAAAVTALGDVIPGAGAGVTVEGHGRDNPVAETVRAENSVGWFTASWPLPVTRKESSRATLQAVRSARHNLPEDTARPGVLRLEHPHPLPELCVNHLGVFTTIDSSSHRAWQPLPGLPAVGGWASPDTPLGSVLDLTTELHERPEGSELRATLRAAGRHVSVEQAERFLRIWQEELRDLVELAATDPGRCPADFVVQQITQAEVDTWSTRFGHPVKEVLPLTALQRSLALSSLASGGADGYIVQSILELHDDSRRLNAEVLADAAGIVVGHHPGLGIAPAASGSDLVGVVTSGLQVPAIELEMEEAAVAEWLKQDARSTFDLSAPPLLRVALLRTPDRCHLVITCHHLITDGWTGQLLMLELARVLAALLEGDRDKARHCVVGDPGTFLRASALLLDKAEETRRVWADVLESVEPLVLGGPRSSVMEPYLVMAELPRDRFGQLAELAAQENTSLHTLCQLAWGHALGSLTGRRSLVFGEVVSGRTLELPGIEESIGCYANTVPGLVDLDPAGSWRQAVKNLVALRRRVLGWEHLSLVDAHRMAGVRKLFDTLYVFQSYPPHHEELADTLRAAGLPLQQVRPGGSTDASAVLMVFPAGSVGGDEVFRCSLHTAPDVLDEEQSRILLDVFVAALTTMAAQPDALIKECQLIDDFDQLALEAFRLPTVREADR